MPAAADPCGLLSSGLGSLFFCLLQLCRVCSSEMYSFSTGKNSNRSCIIFLAALHSLSRVVLSRTYQGCGFCPVLQPPLSSSLGGVWAAVAAVALLCISTALMQPEGAAAASRGTSCKNWCWHSHREVSAAHSAYRMAQALPKTLTVVSAVSKRAGKSHLVPHS